MATVRLQTLINLVENTAEFLSFREVALHCLTLRGYEYPALKDGAWDGGNDITIGRLPPGKSSFAIQLSVEKDWPSKLRKDAAKVRERFDASTMLFVSSRRLPAVRFNEVAETVWQESEVNVRPLDCQDIASTYFEHDEAALLLQLLGYNLTIPRPDRIERPTLRHDAAFAYAFFGSDASDFRNGVIEQTITVAIAESTTSLGRQDVETEAADILGLAPNQRRQVKSAIDRMLQGGRLLMSPEKTVGLPTYLVEAHTAMRAVRNKAWLDLEYSIRAFFGDHGLLGGSLDTATDNALENAGLLIMEAASAASAAITPTGDRSATQEYIRVRLRRLNATLDTLGLANGPERAATLSALTDLITGSTIASHLLSGELFAYLTSLETPHLLRALGAGARLDILLDASVAIPILASELYEPGRQSYFQSSLYCRELCRNHGLALVIPTEYLEEAASHLLQANDWYSSIVARDPDLRLSTNAYVAHYTDLTTSGAIDTPFAEYLRAFGFRAAATEGTFRRRRDAVMNQMASRFELYGISLRRLRGIRTASLQHAEEAITFASRELHRQRAGRLLQHDARILGYLHMLGARASESAILCTWDRVHHYVCDRDPEAGWMALDPAMLADLLALAAGEDEHRPLASPRSTSMRLADADAVRGAAVWDALARIEQSRMHDAKLIDQAATFKAEYVDRLKEDPADEDIAVAWAEWKASQER